MAVTTKTLTPTNQVVTLPDMTEKPNASVLVDGIGKEADAINALNSKLEWKLLEEKPIDGVINYPDNWNELWIIATSEENTYGWSTASLIVPKALSSGSYVTAVGKNNVVLVAYRGPYTVSVSSTASQNVVKWKAYYR